MWDKKCSQQKKTNIYDDMKIMIIMICQTQQQHQLIKIMIDARRSSSFLEEIDCIAFDRFDSYMYHVHALSKTGYRNLVCIKHSVLRGESNAIIENACKCIKNPNKN